MDRVILGVVIFILLAMLVLTKSRGAWLGFGLALLYVLIVSRSFKLILVLAVVLFVLSFWELARQLVFTRFSETTLFRPFTGGSVFCCGIMRGRFGKNQLVTWRGNGELPVS